MIVYSVTVTLDDAIEMEWLTYMTGTHIPDVMATGYFGDYSLNRLLDPAPDPGNVTYNVQYLCESMEDFALYRETRAQALQAEHSERFRNRFVAFRTLLERI